jgi:hypothetical protein
MTERLNLPSIGAWLSLLVGYHIAHADEPKKPAPLDQIVVIGSRPIESKVLEKAATPFVRSHSLPLRITGQIARWKHGICPLIRGLSPPYNHFIEARVRAIAASVDAPVSDKNPCTPNVEVIFTTEPQKLLDGVASDHEPLLGFHWTSQTKRLSTFTGPIQAWYVTATTDAAGVETVDDQREIFNGTAPSPGLGSRISGGTSSAFVHVLIVADTARVTGYTIGSISDYVAMLALSQASSLTDCNPLPSILDLMSPGCVSEEKADSISPVDSAYLRALYRINMRDILVFQQSEINIMMIKELEGR